MATITTMLWLVAIARIDLTMSETAIFAALVPLTNNARVLLGKCAKLNSFPTW